MNLADRIARIDREREALYYEIQDKRRETERLEDYDRELGEKLQMLQAEAAALEAELFIDECRDGIYGTRERT